jgi:hypothetical protein
MAIQTKVYLPFQPADTKTLYAIVRASSLASEPLRINLGLSHADPVWNDVTNQFVSMSTVDCTTSAWEDLAVAAVAENVDCGGLYRIDLPGDLHVANIYLEIFVYEQTGSSPVYASDTLVGTASHYTGDVDFTATIELVPGATPDSARLYATFRQDGRLKDAGAGISFSADLGTLGVTPVNPEEGVYYVDYDLTGVSTNAYVRLGVTGEMSAGYVLSGNWVDPGPVCREVDATMIYRKGSDISSEIDALKSIPIIKGS